MNSLEELFEMQNSLTQMMDLSRYPHEVDERISKLATAIIHEAVELQRLTAWKWWKKPIRFDEQAAREELIDIWHFVIQASIELGMRPSDIVEQYKKKNDINKGRQVSGY
jgi:dimeric dUTPase (all-alpha-NTP-PPase superfamily)